jgi:hypothetical protein
MLSCGSGQLVLSWMTGVRGRCVVVEKDAPVRFLPPPRPLFHLGPTSHTPSFPRTAPTALTRLALACWKGPPSAPK